MDPFLSPLLVYGPLGVIAAIMIEFARRLIRREQERADKLAAEVTRLNDIMITTTVPALVNATSAVTAAHALLQSVKYQQDIDAAAAARMTRKP